MHTKGPWELTFRNGHPHQIETASKSPGEYRHITNDLPFAASPDEPHDEHNNSLEQIASLRLIAAAPDLLEALEAALPILESLDAEYLDDRVDPTVPPVIKQARAAIARAKPD